MRNVRTKVAIPPPPSVLPTTFATALLPPHPRPSFPPLSFPTHMHPAPPLGPSDVPGGLPVARALVHSTPRWLRGRGGVFITGERRMSAPCAIPVFRLLSCLCIFAAAAAAAGDVGGVCCADLEPSSWVRIHAVGCPSPTLSPLPGNGNPWYVGFVGGASAFLHRASRRCLVYCCARDWRGAVSELCNASAIVLHGALRRSSTHTHYRRRCKCLPLCLFSDAEGVKASTSVPRGAV